MEKKFYDSDILIWMTEQMNKEYLDFGAYYNYDGLDIQNLKGLIDLVIK